MALPPYDNQIINTECSHIWPSRVFEYDDTKIKIMVG